MQESYETVISLAEEIAISWPRITAFTETRGRRGLAPGLEMEPEQGQLAPVQGQAAAATTAASSEEGILPDFRRQLGVILQTVGKAQVEKMLRELVKEQEQQGRVRRRKRVARSPRHGGDGRQNSLEAPQELRGRTFEGSAVLARKPPENELQMSPLLYSGQVAGQKQPISGKTGHGDAKECKNSLSHQQSSLVTRWGTGSESRESISRNLFSNMSRDTIDGGRVWPPFGERAQFLSGWQKPRYAQRRRRPPAGEKPHRCGPCRRSMVAPTARSDSPLNSAMALLPDPASTSSALLPLNSIEPLTSTQPLPVNSAAAPPRKPHACEECGKRFRILANLERHQQRHAAEKPHQCRDCGRRFRWGCHLERHRRSRRCVECGGGLATPPPPPSPPPEPDRPYSCGECGRRFTQRSALSKHRRLHSGERPYGCGECGKRFLQRSDLTIHVRSHSGEQPYVCTECGRRFSVSSNLSKHRRMHRGERPHACSVCAKRFLQRSELLIHQRAHTGERPYPCTACGKRFARRAHLKRHQRTHGGVPATATASRHQSARLLTTSAMDTISLLEHERGGVPDALESRPHTNTPCPPAAGPSAFSAARGATGAASLGLPWAVSSSARLSFCSSPL
ncbi:zinc finger protein 260-like isoform X2 [Eublepharis macularius]|uniref:Zinc finger protein 260-like isoform X2 n=1 Tax=Eublepharis macularius TaxID=481883 RepID=A0AA97LDS6_EUBMA|nr:zinc finger protein 260-like isoform X2 [Eublepharis macularius]